MADPADARRHVARGGRSERARADPKRQMEFCGRRWVDVLKKNHRRRGSASLATNHMIRGLMFGCFLFLIDMIIGVINVLL